MKVYIDLDSLRNAKAKLLERIRANGKEKEFLMWAFGVPAVQKGGKSALQATPKQMVTYLHRYCGEVVDKNEKGDLVVKKV